MGSEMVRCNSGHETPRSHWVCPVCHEDECDRLREEPKHLTEMLNTDCEHMIELTAIMAQIEGYLSVTEDCCKGDTACIKCQHRDWFRTFIKPEGESDEQ